MKRYLKRTGALLTAVMLTVMTACGGGGDKEQPRNNSTQDLAKDGMVWKADFFTLDSENMNFYNAVEHGGSLWLLSYDYDGEAQMTVTSLQSYALEDGKAGTAVTLIKPEQTESDEQDGQQAQGDRSVSSFMFDSQGNVVTIERIYSYDETEGSSNRYLFCRYDLEGNRLQETDFTDQLTEQDVYFQKAALDAQDRIYLNDGNQIHLLDAEGAYCGVISPGSDWISGMGAGRDGKMYITVSGSANGIQLKELDFDGKTIGNVYENFINTYTNDLSASFDKDFIGSDGTSLLEYDCASQTEEKMCDWLDCDINGSVVRSLYALEDGRIVVTMDDWTGREGSKPEYAILSKVPVSEMPEKTILTLGSFYQDTNLQSAAVAFNKSNDQYHISIKTYFNYEDIVYTDNDSNYAEVSADAVNRMNSDIASGSGPDLLALSNINVDSLAAKGVFEDLGPYLENSAALDRDDYFENILEAYTFDGRLVAIPKNFQLATLAGRASQLGEEPGWTVSEMLAYGGEHPDAALMSGLTKDYALSFMLQYSLGSYVDWQTGKCDFNQESFEKILEFANEFPADYEYNEDTPSEPTLIQNGKQLLYRVDVYDFNSLQVADAMFENDVCYIGYPNDKGESGTYLRGTEVGIAISSKSAHKDGAWEFLESYLLKDEGEMTLGFPARKSEFQKEREEATKIEYIYEWETDENGNLVTDENGELVPKKDEDGNPIPQLDENGEPMVANAGGGIGWGDWEYRYHVPTEEEVDVLEHLIAIATPATDMDVQIINFITEEAQAYFAGQKSAQDVTGVIQNRVQLYLNENR